MSACEVGPDYFGAPKTASHAESHGLFRRAPESATPAPPPSRWWDRFGDADMAHLIDRALETSPTVKIAEARVRQARAGLSGSEADLLPTFSTRAAYARIHLPKGGLQNGLGSGGTSMTSGTSSSSSEPRQINYYNGGFDATWEIDLFGGLRRGVEAAKAEEQAAEWQLADAHVQLAAEVGQAYIALRDAQHRLLILKDTAVVEDKMARLTDMRRRRGTATDVDYLRLEQQLAQTQAQVAPVESEVERDLDALAMLTAREPGDLDAELKGPAPLPLPPLRTAAGNAGSLLKRRPDIRAAERTLAAQNARIGETEAQQFPQVNLLGTLGWGGTKLSGFGRASTMLWAVAPMLRWNFLDFGKAASQTEQARAERDEAREAYRQTVLMALQNAEDSLSRYGHDRASVTENLKSRDLALRAANIIGLNFRAGTVTLIDQLDAERQRLQAEQSLATAEAQFSTDYIALQKSLGLGWETATDRR